MQHRQGQRVTLATDQLSDGSHLSTKARQFLALREDVIDHWERLAKTQIENAHAVPSPVLTDTLPAFYDNIAQALSPEHPREDATSDNNTASAHGEERARMTNFRVDEVAQEYQLLRLSIAATAAGRVELDAEDWAIIDRSLGAASLEAMRAFMALSEQMRARSAAMLTHDMRTPLAVISNAAELISITLDIERTRTFAAKIATNARRLNAMMAELINTMTSRRLPGSALQLSQFDMLAMVNETLDQYTMFGGGEVLMDCAGDSVVGFWCRDSMQRALENLVNNAIKYGDGGAIKIKTRQSRGRLMLSVSNWGNPIPKERQQGIFDYLKRENNGARAPGWGIGLPFVKSTAEDHGGVVAIDSSSKAGTTFLINVPVDCRPYIAEAA